VERTRNTSPRRVLPRFGALRTMAGVAIPTLLVLATACAPVPDPSDAADGGLDAGVADGALSLDSSLEEDIYACLTSVVPTCALLFGGCLSAAQLQPYAAVVGTDPDSCITTLDNLCTQSACPYSNNPDMNDDAELVCLANYANLTCSEIAKDGLPSCLPKCGP
jgi:hypothetical protein